ncbi:uncharacterized protein LOC111379753 [Olea europaea var. sylvestris]|uniref:uncharacterized protein LOC111379753 n=1 Tax=Olea europaea var. sylvestris TaxID=158386 RepID=UPI000C1CCDCB|nr:uncharacterized protein LOC111379753 [Olea europaea var. sylvestris]
MIYRNNESPLILTHLRSPNHREFLYSIIFLLLVAGYLVRTHLLFVSRASSKLQKKFRNVKSLMIPSSMTELQKLLDRYSTSESNSFWLKNLFLVALEQLGYSLEKIRGSAFGGNMLGPAYGDGCIQRYPALYGSDDRIQACMAELGVPLTKEIGFHQYDVYGNLLGLLGAHPVTPVVSLHHLDVVNPIFPGKTRVQGLKNLFESVKLDSASIIQQSICYNEKQYWSISVSWGFVVQIIRGVISPRELEMPTRTFLNWYRRDGYTAYAFNTRPVSKHPGQKPFMYYMTTTKYDEKRRQVIGVYKHDKESHQHCTWKSDPPEKLDSIFVLKSPDSSR